MNRDRCIQSTIDGRGVEFYALHLSFVTRVYKTLCAIVHQEILYDSTGPIVIILSRFYVSTARTPGFLWAFKFPQNLLTNTKIQHLTSVITPIDSFSSSQ